MFYRHIEHPEFISVIYEPENENNSIFVKMK